MAEGWKRLWSFVGRLPWYRFAAGVLAGGAGLLVTFLMRAFGLGVFLPEIAVDFVVGRIPGGIESFFIRTLGEGAKLLALLTALAVFLVLPGIYATLFRRVQRWLKNRWLVIAFYTFSSAGIVLVVILPLLDAGFLGANTSAGAGFAVFSQLIGYWLYAAIQDHVLVDVSAEYPEGFSLSRRQFIAGTIGAIAVAALTIYGLGSLISKKGRLVFASIAEMFLKEQTPTSEFYVVTKNVIDPTVDAGTWLLSIGGLVSNSPPPYSYADLQGLATIDEVVTLECVSNEVGGNLISTAEWTGVRLATILQTAGADPNPNNWVVFTCADGYTAAIPIAKAMDPNTLVAIYMNGGPLATAHGYPARIIVPGLYGMFHAKWVTRIDVVQGEFRGYWQQKGWTNSDDSHGLVNTVAIIATPVDNAVVGGMVEIGGVAFAGDRGISRVEVSTDGGSTWTDATLYPRPGRSLTWVLWTFNWISPHGGSFRIVARAYDAAGVMQNSTPFPPFPNGASGYDSITLLGSQ
ncbi:MAG TPA: molybdopterin-dependent oxidoreductase [Thermoplasmata archaeon]|nr:molybdopterin-dependent oxidoreductase [Thermoplasmata archaeon]